MAAFGSFAGLACAGAGALCSYEAHALSLFDFAKPRQQQQQQEAKPQNGRNGEKPRVEALLVSDGRSGAIIDFGAATATVVLSWAP